MSGSGAYGGLTRFIVLVIGLGLLIPLSLALALAGYMFHTAYKAKVLDHLAEVVAKHRRVIDGFLAERAADVSVLADIVPPDRLGDEEFLKRLLSSMQAHREDVYVDLGLVAPSGLQLAYAGPYRLGGANYSGALWLKEAEESGVYISDVFTGLRGEPHFIVAAHLKGDPSKPLLRASVDFAAFNRLVAGARAGYSGMAYVVNRDGEFQTQGQAEAGREVKNVLGFATANAARIEALTLREGSTTLGGLPSPRGETTRPLYFESSAEGRDVIHYVAPLKGGQWLLVYSQDGDEAFAELYRARLMAVALTILGLAAIAASAFFVARRVVAKVSRLDREKALMNEQMIEAGKLASLGELAAGIAHEINNPLAIMVQEAGWVEDMLADAADGTVPAAEARTETERAVRQIRKQGARCKEITHKLLSFARRTDPQVREVDVNELIDEVVSLSLQRARYANVKFEGRLAEKLPPVMASPSELQQVVLNLINNAIDAMEPKGGSLTVTTALDGDWVVLTVSDTGAGIPEANLQRIFDPFFTTKAVGKGTGLGLSICYGIVKKNGGTINVASTLDKGTTFSVRLPAKARPRPEAGQPLGGA